MLNVGHVLSFRQLKISLYLAQKQTYLSIFLGVFVPILFVVAALGMV